MKLNNSQINALADKIYKEVLSERKDSEATKNNFEGKLTPEELKEYKEIKKFLTNKGFSLLDKVFKVSDEHTVKGILNDVQWGFVRKINDRSKRKSLCVQDIKNAIVLKTIECEDLDSIMKSVKKDFLK